MMVHPQLLLLSILTAFPQQLRLSKLSAVMHRPAAVICGPRHGCAAYIRFLFMMTADFPTACNTNSTVCVRIMKKGLQIPETEFKTKKCEKESTQ
jgi:hypothetical protein